MKIKYGQIGVQHAHANKIRVYRKSERYEVVGIVEPDPRARVAAERDASFEGLPWLTEEQLLNRSDVQVIGVETEVKDLLSTAEKCIAADKHIHLDKPAGDSLPHFKRILDAASQKHLAVQMGYMYRYNPAVILMRDWLRRGWLGDPFEVHTVMSKLVNHSGRAGFEAYAGGAMFELGCHIIDLVVGVLGTPDKVHAFPRHSANTDDRCLDNMLSVFEYAKATATVRSSINEIDGFARRQFTLCGSDGTFHIQPLDDPKAMIALRRERPGHPKKTHEQRFEEFTRYEADAEDLARIVSHEKDSEFSYEHDFQVQRALLLASGLPIK
ncbi:Gfo/Idh/MocA family protein [Planctomycetota bacterium]